MCSCIRTKGELLFDGNSDQTRYYGAIKSMQKLKCHMHSMQHSHSAREQANADTEH